MSCDDPWMEERSNTITNDENKISKSLFVILLSALSRGRFLTEIIVRLPSLSTCSFEIAVN